MLQSTLYNIECATQHWMHIECNIQCGIATAYLNVALLQQT